MAKEWNLKAQHLVRLFLCTLFVTTTVPTTASADDDEHPLYGFGGTLIYEQALGRGAFAGTSESAELGAADLTSYGHSLSIRPSYTISKKRKMKLTLRMDLSQELVESYGHTTTTPNDVLLGDLRLSFGWTDFVKVKEAFLSWNLATTVYFPTSRLSQLQTKVFAWNFGITNKFKPVDWFRFDYAFSFTKSFHEFTNPVIDEKDFDIPLTSRANGAEVVGEGLAALGGVNTEWSLNHRIGAIFTFLEDFSFEVHWYYYQYFGYGEFADDEFTSPHAKSGKPYSDLMQGVIEFGYTVTPNLSLAIGTLTAQSPKTDDNESFRFPFWDTTNGADNRQTFYFDVIGRF